MIVKYLSYSLGYRQPSTVNRQHKINLFFAFLNIIYSFYKSTQNYLFFFDSKKEPRQSRADAKNYSFFCKKRKQKNINNRNLKLNNYVLGNFLKFTLFSNGNYIPLIQNIKFYLYSLFNNFEIISLLDYGFCYITALIIMRII